MPEREPLPECMRSILNYHKFREWEAAKCMPSTSQKVPTRAAAKCKPPDLAATLLKKEQLPNASCSALSPCSTVPDPALKCSSCWTNPTVKAAPNVLARTRTSRTDRGIG